MATETPTFIYVGVDAKDNHDVVAVACTQLVDIVKWCKRDATFRRFFSMTIAPGTQLFRTSYDDDMNPIPCGSVNSPK